MTHKSIFILGRQPAIGRAELESLFGAAAVEPIGERAMACRAPVDEVNFNRTGGSTRLAEQIAQFETDKWPEVLHQVASALPGLIGTLPAEGKIKLGLSVFGLNVRSNQLFAAGLELKKIFKKAGRSVRLVPNTELELSSAQVLHNQLTGELGLELIIIKNGRKTVLARTKAVQDISAYAHRDQGRPKRDAKVGMLPPKLAQIIINLAVGGQRSTLGDEVIVLDPFCGTGVILQEALLMDFRVYGTDIEPRMIDYSRANLEWLAQNYTLNADRYTLEIGDATDHQWQLPFSAVASETYLGRPLGNWPRPETLHEIMGTCNVIIERFLRNIGGQVKPGTRLCLAVPCWKSPNERFYRLPLLDHLDKMGYNRVSFEHAKAEELIYYRPDQIVARELLVITKE